MATGDRVPPLDDKASKESALVYARLTLPAWLWGGDPEKALRECRYHWRRDDSGNHLVVPEERYLHRPPRLVTAFTIAGPGVKRPRWQALARVPEPVPPPAPPNLERELARRQRAMVDGADLLALLDYQRLDLYRTPSADLPSKVADLHDILVSSPSDLTTTATPLADAGVHVVAVNHALQARAKLVSVYLRLEHDEKLAAGEPSHIQTLGSDEQAFDSAAGLHTGIYVFDAYMTPLLAALTPDVWAISILRPGWSLVMSFGCALSGLSASSGELLQFITIPGADSRPPLERLSREAPEAAVQWWVGRLDQMFGVISDPSTFTVASGTYLASKHLQTLLTVEQVFRRTASMQLAHRDVHARRTLMFSVLDSLVGLNGWDLSLMFDSSHARSVLEKLEGTIPGPAGEILLPRAKDGVQALASVQDGFFLRRQLQTKDVVARGPDGSAREISPADASMRYMRLLRNATHGHGGKASNENETSALLAHHDGDVSSDIGFLAYLYLLDLLNDPDRLRRCVTPRGK